MSGNVCEGSATTPIQVTVQTIPTAGAIATNQTICTGGDPAAFTSSDSLINFGATCGGAIVLVC